MKSIDRIMCFAGAAGLVAGSAWAGEGVLLVQKTTVAGGTPETHQIQIEPRRMRAEASGPRGGRQVLIFDGIREVMLIVDDEKKTYSEISKADVDALGSQVSSAMAQMQEQMKNLPPEQRAQIEAMMRGRGMPGGRAGLGAAAPSKVQYRRTGTDTVGAWTCDKYEGYSDGQKTRELCTVDPKALGFTAADFAVTKDLAAFFQKLVPASASELFHIGTADEQGFSGVPVRSITTVAGRQIVSELSDVHRQSFPDSTFQAPAGYQKTDSPFTGRGRR